jgi:hypothetical protein
LVPYHGKSQRPIFVMIGLFLEKENYLAQHGSDTHLGRLYPSSSPG